MASLELSIKLQKDRICDRRGFLLFYTTRLNSQPVHSQNIKTNSDRITVPNWGGLNDNGLPSVATACEEKARIIEAVIHQLSRKYDFNVTAESRIYEIQTRDEHLFCIAGTFKVVQS
jgi:hypothetical protein